ncbi:diguanylate cyclase/phosphodiesterase with PAS/PAC and GAF sensor(s) [Cellvibrio sp. BR]|uniref:putative bifunctional diguanylate cyclase/phosphodiesterase n=1 Tax=Cellvibrio sp. BR TaxID=1134474 RepID=UPI0002600D8A|nr:EAL domain-containing protein [Cellvibrio sp. BR]EIK43090.1 diguanylate cyclase/phosphodiesterase with PAS/PAC and GAF sensor(s) [Cellvibrio sp. BR]
MKCPAKFPNESARLNALADYGLDQEQMLQSLDPVVRIASRMFDMPVAAVNMIGSDHVFFAASVGVGDVDMRRDVSFCAHAITQSDVMVVPDATLDERFHDNPLVVGEANLRFYAGVPLLSPDGLALGALCVIDDRPHSDFSREDRQRLLELAKMAADRLELRRIEVSTERSRPPFHEYAGSSSSAVIWFDEQLQIIEWNNAAAEVSGYRLEDKNALQFDLLLPERDRAHFRALITQAIDAYSLDQINIPTEVTWLRKDGSEFRFSFALFGWRDGGHMKFEAVLKDLSAQQREEEALRQQANIDGLTGLANRGKFYRSVEEILISPAPATVLMIDLDGFKDVNDTLGHTLGDAILCEVANRLSQLVSSEDLVARIGGDEFAILLANVTDAATAMHVADAVLAAIAQPINVDGNEVRVAASCGVALAPTQAQEALELVGNADLALFKAKSNGRGRVFLFVPALRMEAMARRLYGLELHRAVDKGEFLLFYQPQINMADGTITGAEALIRWLHPERGLLTPAAFLPALEGGPLAATVGSWILDEACAQAAYWRRSGAPDFRIGVNLCSAQFRVGDLAAEVMETLARHGLPAEALELEVTENIVLDNDDIVLEILQRLHQQGVGIAFDDFGTGYASLSLLKTYPLSRIKIDQSFVRGILTSKRDASVVRAIIDMARNFDLEVIAEGIETQAEYNYLRREQCDEGQGYLFGAPMPVSQFELLLGIGSSLKAIA